ncbi:MAG: glycosyltransferase family 4 protein [Rhodoferax sp.]|nr:glycosyltransferase family 4 protein [Rhodoferax sp.]
MNKEEKMRILFIADHLKLGGAERHLVAVATGLAALGNEVAVAYMKPHHELVNELAEGGVTKAICCNSRGGIDLAAIRRLALLIQNFRPTLLVATSQYSLMLTVLARFWTRRHTPLLFVCHSMEVVQRARSDRIRFAVYRQFYRRAEHVVFVSALQRTFFQQLGVQPRSDEVIHNGIDLDRFSAATVASASCELRRTLGFSDGDLVIGMCAGFREEKRQVDLLEALRRLRDRGFPAKALLVGDGVMRAQIEARRDALGLQDAVVLCGFQQDVRPYVAACDVMALTSHAETFPIATLEYMALGKPLVASNVGGLSEQVSDGHNGLLYPAGDIDALVGCLKQLSDSAVRQSFGRIARQHVVARFSLPAMIERFRATCVSLATAGRQP